MKTVFFTLLSIAVLATITFGAVRLKASNGSPNPVAVGLGDGRVLFGNLHGSTLCNYLQPVTGQDRKTHKPTISLQTGGSVYGGDGCLEIREPILFVEHLTPASTLYKQLSNSK